MATHQVFIRESYEAGKMKACRTRPIVKMSMCYSSNRSTLFDFALTSSMATAAILAGIIMASHEIGIKYPD